jgi:hypothetical protein
MWLVIETPEMVDVTPQGEEEWHIRDVGCRCWPSQTQDVQGRLMLIHNTLEPATIALPADVQRAA